MKTRRTLGVAQPRTPAKCSGTAEPPHAEAKGTTSERGLSHGGGRRRQGVNRLAAGLDRGREQDGAVPLQRQARPMAARRFPPGPNRPVDEGHDPAGEPVAGKPHGGFGERGAETQPCAGLRHRHDAAASRESGRRTATPPRYSRRAAPRLYVRRGKALVPSGFESRPATVAPAGSNRSGSRRKRDGLKHSG